MSASNPTALDPAAIDVAIRSDDAATEVARGPLLPAVMRSEWTKLRSVRSTLWSLFAVFGITVGLGVLFSWAYISRFQRLSLRERLTFDPTAHSLRGLFLAQLAAGVLGVILISSEYATGFIRATFQAVPQRRVVLAAKAIVYGCVLLVVSMVAAFVAFFGGQAVLKTKHLGVAIGDPHVLRAVLGAGAYLTIVGLLGLAIATILRRTAGAVATLFGLVLVVPLLAQALPSPWNHDVAKYSPSQLGEAMFSVRADPNLLTPGRALLVAGVWLVVAYTTAAILLVRRDT